MPFAEGNRWEYAHVSPDKACKYERENIFEVTSAEKDTATVSFMCFIQSKGYFDTWEGKMAEASDIYYEDNNILRDIRPYINRAAELAVTKRQKLYSDSLGDGWHGSVEFTADEEDGKLVVFKNALGTQDRANYEADTAQ